MRVIICPHCDMKYRIDPAKFQQDELRIKCKSCEGSFAVDITDPDSQAYPLGQKPAPAQEPTPEPEAPRESAPPSAPSEPASPAAPPRTSSDGAAILVAHESEELRNDMLGMIQEAGMNGYAVANGVDALMYIEQHRPPLAILDVALPKMFGFEVCEVVRRDSDLENVKIILIAAIYDKSRYKRNPTNLYGADDYIEKHNIPEELVQKCQSLLGDSAGAHESESPPAAQPQVPSAPEPEPASPPAPSAADVDPDLLERARRLSRTIISDIALYNEDKINEAVENGNAPNLLATEIAEGQELFDSRIDESIRNVEPFLLNALDAYIENKKKNLGLT